MSTPSIAGDAPRYAGEEWATRVELAALHRIADRYGMSDIANQEIGARVGGPAAQARTGVPGLQDVGAVPLSARRSSADTVNSRRHQPLCGGLRISPASRADSVPIPPVSRWRAAFSRASSARF